MLGPLTAARKNGETFEDLAKLMTAKGYPLAASTLRNYYFELRADADLKALVRDQAEVLAETRRRLVDEVTNEQVRQESLSMLKARKRQVRLANSPKLKTAAELEVLGQEPLNEAQGDASSQPPSSPTYQRNQKAHPTARMEAADKDHAQITMGVAPSIQLLEKLAESVPAKVNLPKNVALRDGVHAYYDDGSPLDRAISLRQVRLLKSSGHLIASGSEDGNRTAGGFVQFPKSL
jgi:hypothetical protein